MAKPEWGTKRICLSCGARFYDMQRDPIVCPACSATLDLTAHSRPRRSRAAAKTVAVEPDEVEVDDTEETAAAAKGDDQDDDVADDASESDEEDSDSAIEDVSELGDDDMTDVIDTEIENDDSER